VDLCESSTYIYQALYGLYFAFACANADDNDNDDLPLAPYFFPPLFPTVTCI